MVDTLTSLFAEGIGASPSPARGDRSVSGFQGDRRTPVVTLGGSRKNLFFDRKASFDRKRSIFNNDTSSGMEEEVDEPPSRVKGGRKVTNSLSAPELRKLRPKRVNHLGVRVHPNGVSRTRQARSLTIVYGMQASDRSGPESKYALMREAGKVVDFSTAALADMCLNFKAITKPEQVFVRRRTFHQVLEAHGMHDEVQRDRFFDEWADKLDPMTLDYRSFLRFLACATDEPIQHRLDLLFDVYDINSSGLLSLAELTQIVTDGRSPAESAVLASTLDELWENDLKAPLASPLHDGKGGEETFWSGFNRNSGVPKEVRCHAETRLRNPPPPPYSHSCASAPPRRCCSIF